MRQHVNPLSKHFNKVETLPPLSEIYQDPKLPLHIDVGSAAGDFLFDLALENNNWNYLGIEIREKLVKNAKSRVIEKEIRNLYFAFGNANKIFISNKWKLLIRRVKSISFNFPDPWFKKRHIKRRLIQPEFINLLSTSIQKGSLIFIKTDVKELFDFMEFNISRNLNLRKLDNDNFIYSSSFNPTKIQTNREKYAINNKLNIFERIYIKI